MLGSIRRTLRNLKLSTSGNATLLVAIGMPAMIGGSGLAVDTAQWYMWKRELQNAADQAALAGAWARTDTDTASLYQSRAAQEYAANVATVADFDTAPVVALANYDSGTNNSVVVTASAAKELPFSSILTNKTITVSVSSQATFTAGTNYTACMLAIRPCRTMTTPR
jgi:Flp pilus assembly protein TadG